MKAMEKNRTRRYDSAAALAEDVRRHLSDESVEACPPSISYRFAKFARRNKMVLSASSLLAVALLLGISGASWYAIEAKNAGERERIARIEADKAGTEARKQAQVAWKQAYIADMNVAMMAWHENDLVRVQQILD